MNISDYIANGTPWSIQEDQELGKMYNQNSLTITQISNITKRTPGQIAYRLCKKEYETDRKSCRGYDEYVNSELYKSIVNSSKSSKSKKSIKKNNKLNNDISINISTNNNLEKEIKGLRNEVKGLKNEVKYLIDFVKAIYTDLKK